jgi:RHS repeat-associated protein
VGKKADADCWAKVYVENLSSQAVWFDDLEIQTGALPTALVVQETHYDPWGLELAGIGYIADAALEHQWKTARLRFNGGVERTVDFGLSWDESGARNYDARLGRWWSVDPRPNQSLSPYAAMNNNPVRFADPLGDTVQIRYGGFLGIGRKTVVYNNGQLTNRDGSAYTGKVKGFLAKATNALNTIRNGGGVGTQLVSDLQNSSKTVRVQRGDSNSFKAKSGDLAVVKWSPSSTQGGLDVNGNRNVPSFIGLGHELGHGHDWLDGRVRYGDWSGSLGTHAEKYSMHVENMLRAENGLPLRAFYGADYSSGSAVGKGQALIPGTSQSPWVNVPVYIDGPQYADGPDTSRPYDYARDRGIPYFPSNY